MRHHQIARHEVAVHIHAGCGQVALRYGLEGFVQHLALGAVDLQLPMLGEVPIGEQRQLAMQQSGVIGGQHAGATALLQRQQRVDGPQIKALVSLRVITVDHLHHGVCANVVQQHEALRFVPGQDAGSVQTCVLHQTRNAHKGFTVFFVGRRIHDDA